MSFSQDTFLFQTWTFALFFALVYAVYLPLRTTRWRTAWLLLASCVFYASWHPLYLVLLLYAAAIDYVVVVGMANADDKDTPKGTVPFSSNENWDSPLLKDGFRTSAGSHFRGGWLNPLCLLFALLSAAVACAATVRLADRRSKRPWLAISIANNVGMFGFFACGTFVADNLSALLEWLHVPYAMHIQHVTFLSDGFSALLGLLGLPKVAPLDLAAVLPAGMSFYLFQSLTYTIDYYRGNCPRETSFLRYVEFVSFFPKLLMGPIERARNILPQLRETPRITRQDVADGLSLFATGLFKKLALADALGIYVDQVYGSPGEYQGPALLVASFAFGWQLYFDFSGYSDMARGVAQLLGVRLMLNFNNPYLATGLGDFWRRWHISLSTWFRDYVYIPLGGNRKGEFRTCVNLWLTMVISGLWHNGLWHNATWAFVVWGAVHGFGYVLTRPLERSAFYQQRVPRPLKQMLTFAIVTLAWVFFRAGKGAGLGDAWLVLKGIFTTGWGVPCAGWADPQFPLLLLAFILAVWAYQFAFESRFRRCLALPPVRVGLMVLMVLYLVLCGGSGGKFIYQ